MFQLLEALGHRRVIPLLAGRTLKQARLAIRRHHRPGNPVGGDFVAAPLDGRRRGAWRSRCRHRDHARAAAARGGGSAAEYGRSRPQLKGFLVKAGCELTLRRSDLESDPPPAAAFSIPAANSMTTSNPICSTDHAAATSFNDEERIHEPRPPARWNLIATGRLARAAPRGLLGPLAGTAHESQKDATGDGRHQQVPARKDGDRDDYSGRQDRHRTKPAAENPHGRSRRSDVDHDEAR